MRIGLQCYGRCSSKAMDKLTYRRDVIAYQLFIGGDWIRDYASEDEACEAAKRLALESEKIEIRRFVEEYWESED